MTVIQKVNYIDTSALDVDQFSYFKELLTEENHNNGHAFTFRVEAIKDAGYPKLTQWLMDHGMKVGETVIIHSNW